jgi:hypothetical protein
MVKRRLDRIVALGLIASLLVSLCGCSDPGLKYHSIYVGSLVGAAVGAIVGHQSDEAGAGAIIGAVVGGTGEYLRQVDKINERAVEQAAADIARGDYLYLSMTAARSNATVFD